MSDSKTAADLRSDRDEAWRVMDEYFEANYPFTDETYQQYELLSKKAVEAVEAFMIHCAPRWKR
jgi:hypothetical protein